MSQPRSIIRLYEVYDLTPDYLHTRYFATEQLRDAYFLSHIGHITDANGQTVELTWYQTQHIRIDDGYVKLPYPIKEIHDFTYMSIKNSKGTNNSDDHIYYCFVTDMEYVSDMCTKVYFQVDVMQTYWNRFGTYSSLVERSHSETDTFGDNIKAEPFNPTEFIVNEETYSSQLDDMVLIVGVCSGDLEATINWLDGQGDPQSLTIDLRPSIYYKNTFTCVKYLAFHTSLLDSAMFIAFLNYFRGQKAKEIVDMYLCPSVCIDGVDNVVEVKLTEATNSPIVTDLPVNGKGANLGKLCGYTVVNQKMFTYPFNFLRVVNGEGQKKDYAYEYFFINHVGHSPEFEIEGSFFGEPSVSLFPKMYKRQTTARVNNENPSATAITNQINYDDSITLNGYPHSAWNIDYWDLYKSQNSQSNAIKLLGSVLIGGLVGALTGGLGAIGAAGVSSTTTMAGTGLATTVTHSAVSAAGARAIATGALGGAVVSSTRTAVGNIAESIQAKNTADITMGSTVGGDTPQAHGHKNFTFYRMTVDPQYAKMVDDFFTMYGYTMNEIMDIKTHLNTVKTRRRHYCYIKTTNFIVQGGIENKYKLEIASILNNGITFWYKTDEPMGDYSVDNKVVVG